MLFLILTIIIWTIGFFLKRNLDKISQKRNFEAKNVTKMIINLSQILLISLMISFVFEIQSSTILSISALLGTAIGFALSVVIANIVASFYLIAIRPFGIGDLIKVDSIDGIVLEIGLNYTKLLKLDRTIVLIPNKRLIDANLINCSIQIKELEERSKMGFEVGYSKLLEEIKDQTELKKQMLNEITGGREIIRYPFTVQLKLNIISPDITIKTVNERMDTVLDRWQEKLGYRPRYFYNKYIFRQDVRLVMVVDDAYQILELQTDFLEDIYRSVFSELQGGTN
ncbi:MAG: mechanosensitive ion channel [Candidatus Heimdallarchaeota archaeon]|nr:mechanosensitive ion channel [Candidatus Heimdallarchaeota archaeon]